MVFSFFKKKDKPPEEKMPERPAARPKPLLAPLVPPVRAVPVEPSPAAKGQALPDLEFSAASLAKPAVPDNGANAASSSVQKAVPAAARPACAPPEQAAMPAADFTVSEFERNFTESSVMAIDVDHGLDPVLAEVEQVAVLYANSQDAAARSLLDVFVRTYQGEEARRFWAMYFDFLRMTGDRAAFDKLGIEFAKACETSPPTWKDIVASAPGAPADVARFQLQGVLTAEHGLLLTPMLAALERKSAVSLSCGKLLGCDDDFAGQLAALLQRARRLGIAVTLEGVESLLNSLRTRMVVGRREHLASWRLFFELLQRSGAQGEFEERAVDFAVTFEQSPPSWESIAALSSLPAAPVLPKDAYYLSGDIRSCKFDELQAVFEKHRMPILDFSGVRRMDFFSAGQLANRLGIFKHGGREVIIRSPNNLVAELMGVVGINKYARLLVPKF